MAATRDGRPVWISEVRRQCRKGDSFPLTIKLTLFSEEEREFSCPVPCWQNSEERDFALRYISSEIHNMLAALGAREIVFIYDTANSALTELLQDTEIQFTPSGQGCGRIAAEINRILRTLGGGPLRFTYQAVCDSASQLPPPADAREENTALPELLRSTAKKAVSGLRLGIDVGGTDIKLALAEDGAVTATGEYDWNPSEYKTAGEITGPILAEAEKILKGRKADSIGLSFPDVVINDAIVGGETPKTLGMRLNKERDYETEFARITNLRAELLELCIPGGSVHCANDGNIAAYSAAVELAFSDAAQSIAKGVAANALGTSAGAGWLPSTGIIPSIPLEFYDDITDIAAQPGRYSPNDLRSTVDAGSGFPTVDRYTGQAAAFRYAWETAPYLLDGFAEEINGNLSIKREPGDMRKPCLEHLMTLADAGNEDALQVFRRIGQGFAGVVGEMERFLSPGTGSRYVFGRFVKHPGCFAALKEGFETILPEIELIPADSALAFSPLMQSLAEREGVTVAQFGQAVGAIYYGTGDY